MLLYDTASRTKSELQTPDGVVRIYVCGITPYDTTHLGHALTYLTFDVLVRYLRYQGYQTRYVRNVTDVDDDILRKARELGEDYLTLGERYTRVFQEDMAALGALPPDVEPRATQEVPGILEIVETLVQRGHAYVRGGNVYFRVRSAPEYGQLSHYSREEMVRLAAERGGDPNDPRKEDPLDFVLWQASAPGEPAWESPWGPGRPGWHIECSAMALRYLGERLQVHGGGADLIFPHHESEIVQSERFTGQRPFVQKWVHVAMLYLDGAKMSKSLGNMVFVRDLLTVHHPDAVRAYLLGTHYRTSLEWSPAAFAAAAERAARWRAAAALAPGPAPGLDPAPFRERFLAALDDDLDTPAALAVLDELAAALLADGAGDRAPGQAALRELGGLLGLRLA